MRVKPWVAFTTTLPDDQVEGGRGIVLFGGRNVAVAIGELLSELGCDVQDPYEAEEDGSWEFLLKYRGRHRFWCRVTSYHPGFHLRFESLGGHPTAAKNEAYVELALKLAAAFKSAPQFQDISWWSSREGPPEPDKIGLAAVKKAGREDRSSPISTSEKPGGRPAWGCLALSLYIIVSGVVSVITYFAGLHIMGLWGTLFCGGSLIVVGLFGLVRAWYEPVDT